MAAVLAGTSKMTQFNFYFASCSAAVVWIMCYGLGSYLFGKAFTSLASWTLLPKTPCRTTRRFHSP